MATSDIAVTGNGNVVTENEATKIALTGATSFNVVKANVVPGAITLKSAVSNDVEGNTGASDMTFSSDTGNIVKCVFVLSRSHTRVAGVPSRPGCVQPAAQRIGGSWPLPFSTALATNTDVCAHAMGRRRDNNGTGYVNFKKGSNDNTVTGNTGFSSVRLANRGWL